MRYAIGLAIAVTCLLAAFVPADARRVALVVGNADYKLGPLANPLNDAAAVAGVLERQLLFDKVILRKNLAAEAFRAALRELAREAIGAEIGAVYFAGHGIEVAGRNYLIPTDAALASAGDIELEAIALDTVINQLDGVRKLKLVILDACRNNPFPVAGGKRSVSRGLVRFEPGGNTLVAYAAKDGTTAEDGKGRHSPFTQALLQRIATPGLDVRRLFGYVSDDVLAATNRQQEPYLYGRLGGEEIYLRPPAGAPAGKVPPAVQPSAAALEWARVDKGSIAEIETFIARHPASAEADYARARLRELRRQKAAVQTPPVRPSYAPHPAPPPATASPPPQSRYCARSEAGQTYCVSSVLAPQFGNTYVPRHLFDGNERTAWVHGSGSTGVGAWVSVTLGGRRVVRAIRILNGYTKNRDIFSKNTRVRRAQLVFSDGQTRSIELADSMSWQTVPVHPPVEAEWVQLRISDVYRGWKYADTAISELRIDAQ